MTATSTHSRQFAEQHMHTILARLAGPGAVPRADQVDAVHAVLQPASRVLVVQATGWGKSAVYWAATHAIRSTGAGPTLVVSPLLALMRDQVSAAERAGLKAATVNSTNVDDWDEVFQQLDADAIDVLLVSPERLGNPRFAARLGALLARVGLIVIDEAHCISDWGFDFRPDYQRLARALLSTPTASVLATTATANERVTQDIGAQLSGGRDVGGLMGGDRATTQGGNTVTFRGTLARTSLTLSVVPDLSPLERYAWMADALAQMPGSGIIYVLTVAEAERLTAFLRSCGHAVDAYTGQIDADTRLKVEDRLRHNQVKAVVATSALGMGYDKPDLGFCVHVGSPSTPVAYYQQVGRAGRAVAHAEGVLLPSDADERIWDYFATASIPHPQTAVKVLHSLNGVGRSLIELEADTGVRRGRLEALLKILAVEGVVSKDGSVWQATGVPYVHDTAKWNALAQVRQQEAGIMRQYAHGQGCLMAYLQTALDDPSPAPCGRCSVCTGHLPFPGLTPSSDKLIAARDFLRGVDVEIEPRKRWPSGVGRKGNIQGFAAGRAVAFADDPGWVAELQALKTQALKTRALSSQSPNMADTSCHADLDEVPPALLEGAVATLGRWAKNWPARPVCVVPLPAPDMALNQNLAAHIARCGKLPLHDVLRWTGGPAPDDAASPPVVAHLEAAIHWVRQADGHEDAHNLPSGTVLLVASHVRTRWAATVAAALLREHGASQVLLLALHLQP
jgi:ATP-dependent DNA helicase RecQ